MPFYKRFQMDWQFKRHNIEDLFECPRRVLYCLQKKGVYGAKFSPVEFFPGKLWF